MHKGFTLIETIIYLALFSVLMTGALVAAYNLLEGEQRMQTRAMVQEEGNFILGKFERTMLGASSIDEPIANTTGTTLRVTKSDGGTVTLERRGTSVRIDTGSGPQPLTGEDVRVMNMLFSHTLAKGSDIVPEEVQVSFEVETLTPNGMRVSERFPTTTIALRK